jgi:hypothetical protein
MPGIQGLFYDQAALSLVAEIVESAMIEAKKCDAFLPGSAKQRRMLLIRRILRGIEAGETDMERLKELALLPRKTTALGRG